MIKEMPLNLYKKLFAWFYFCSFEENKWDQYRNLTVSSINLVIQAVILSGCLAHVWTHYKNDLGEALYALFIAMGTLHTCFILLIAIFLRKELIGIFSVLQQLYNRYKSEDHTNAMAKANDGGKLAFGVFMNALTVPCNTSQVLITLISVVLCYMKHGAVIPDYLYHLFKMILPWNQHTVVGWLGEFFISLPGCTAYCFICGLYLSFFISICLYHLAFLEIFTHMVEDLNKIKLSKGPERKSKLKKRLCDIINFHIAADSFCKQTVDALSPFILIHLMTTMICLPCGMFSVDMSIQHVDASFFIVTSGSTSVGSILALYCYYGKKSTDTYSAFGDCVYGMDWYDLPVNLQKYFTLTIANAQVPIYYHGLGIAYLNLESYTKMMKTICYYYWGARKLSH